MGESKQVTTFEQTCTTHGCGKKFQGTGRTDICPACRRQKSIDRWAKNYRAEKTKVCGIDGCTIMIFPQQLGCKHHAPAERKRLGIGKKDAYNCHEEDIKFEAAISAQKILQKAGMTRKMVVSAVNNATGANKNFKLCSRAELERRIEMDRDEKERKKRLRLTHSPQ